MAALEDAAVKRIGDISVKIREAIRAALPTGQEQYFHVMVPGKVVDFDVCASRPISSSRPPDHYRTLGLHC